MGGGGGENLNDWKLKVTSSSVTTCCFKQQQKWFGSENTEQDFVVLLFLPGFIPKLNFFIVILF